MTSEANKLLVRHFVEDVWNAGQFALLDEIIHPVYGVPGVGQGPAGVARNIASFRLAFPDLVWTIEDMVAEGDRVAVRLVLTGTHLGPFRDIAPTGRRVTMQEMGFWRIVDGKLHTCWSQADSLGLRRQLGQV